MRLHRFFEAAPREVQEALASWMRSGRRARRACELLDRWIQAEVDRLPADRPRQQSIVGRGHCHDLHRHGDDDCQRSLVLRVRRGHFRHETG